MPPSFWDRGGRKYVLGGCAGLTTLPRPFSTFASVRCSRLGLPCVAQQRGPGRPKRRKRSGGRISKDDKARQADADSKGVQEHGGGGGAGDERSSGAGSARKRRAGGGMLGAPSRSLGRLNELEQAYEVTVRTVYDLNESGRMDVGKARTFR